MKKYGIWYMYDYFMKFYDGYIYINIYIYNGQGYQQFGLYGFVWEGSIPKNINLTGTMTEFSDVPFSDKTKSPQGDAPVNVG